MRRLSVLAILLALCLTTLQAASYTKFEALAVAGTAVGFTAANINNTTGAHPAATSSSCRLELAEIRYTIDTTTPTSTVGTLMEIGDTLILNGNDTLNNFKAIRTTAVSGQLDCTHVGSY
jgi:hypothetical protein